MSDLASYLPSLRQRIAQATSAALQRAVDVDVTLPEAQELLDAAKRSVSSGKRFRAIGAFIGAAVTTDTVPGATDAIDDLAAALELYQASALVHDDVIDHADTRRGDPTPHRLFAEAHTQRRWLGDSRQFGEAAAILLGDLLFSAAEDAVHRCATSLPSLRGAQVLARYSRMHAEVALGQYLDVRAEQTPLNPSEERSIDQAIITEVVRLKSARYSVVHPMLLGATAVGASRELLATLKSIVHPWGMAFQYRDDVLGVFGDPEVTGKPAGDDLIEGKRTLLLSLTWNAASQVERAFISDVFKNPRKERAAYVEDLRDIIRHRGEKPHEATISALVAEGRQALTLAVAQGQIGESSAQLLDDLGRILSRRSA